MSALIKYEWRRSKEKSYQALVDIMKKILRLRVLIARGEVDSALDMMALLVHKYCNTK